MTAVASGAMRAWIQPPSPTLPSVWIRGLYQYGIGAVVPVEEVASLGCVVTARSPKRTAPLGRDEPIFVGGLAEKPEATRLCITRSVTIAPAVRESIVREGVGFGALMTSSPSTVRETSIGSRRADGCFPVNFPFSD